MRFGIPEIARNAHCLVGITVEQHGPRAGRHECFRCRAADAACAARNEGDFSIEAKAVEH
jgi:hypothetical protein